MKRLSHNGFYLLRTKYPALQARGTFDLVKIFLPHKLKRFHKYMCADNPNFTSSPPLPFRLIDHPQAWQGLTPRLRSATQLAIDLEGKGYHHYPDRICLIQIGLPEQVFVIDVLAILDVSVLKDVLLDPLITKIFHSCENDLRILQRDYGFKVRNIFDTAIAANFLGAERLGLANVLQQFLGVKIVKKKQLQRQDWSSRPLDSAALIYAATDVSYLIPLYDFLTTQLKTCHRLSWIQEECQRLEKIQYLAPPPPAENFWQVKGIRGLTPRQRAIFKELYMVREQLALEIDRPPTRLLPNHLLIALAQNPQLKFNPRLNWHPIWQGKNFRMLKHAWLRGKHAPLIQLPLIPASESVSMPADAKRRLSALKSWRRLKGHGLGLDPALLWPTSSFVFLSRHPEQFEHELIQADQMHSEIRLWQKHEFAAEIQAVLQKQEKLLVSNGV